MISPEISFSKTKTSFNNLVITSKFYNLELTPSQELFQSKKNPVCHEAFCQDNCNIVCYDFGLVAIYVGDEKVVYASEAEGCVFYGDLDMESIAAIKQIVSYSDDIEGVG